MADSAAHPPDASPNRESISRDIVQLSTPSQQFSRSRQRNTNGIAHATIRPSSGPQLLSLNARENGPSSIPHSSIPKPLRHGKNRSDSDRWPATSFSSRARSISPSRIKSRHWSFAASGSDDVAPARVPETPIPRWMERLHRSIPPKLRQGWLRTGQLVNDTLEDVFDLAEGVVHEALIMSPDLLGIAPIPGLAPVAKTLLHIWNALQKVNGNEASCWHLTSRCATILTCILEEVKTGGSRVDQDLLSPIRRLMDCFNQILLFLQDQEDKVFLKRFLRRQEIEDEIRRCDRSLDDAFKVLDFSIQMRIWRHTKKLQELRRLDEQEWSQDKLHEYSKRKQRIVDISDQFGLLSSEISSLTSGQASPVSARSIDRDAVKPDTIAVALQEIVAAQTKRELDEDLNNLIRRMTRALDKNDDIAIIGILQVSRHEMPEAIVALQRALKKEIGPWNLARGPDSAALEHLSALLSGNEHQESMGMVADLPHDDSSTGPMELKRLEKKFMKAGLDALRRNSDQTSFPRWTITQYEIHLKQKIGMGFYSDVFRGSWLGRTVAIKVLQKSNEVQEQLFMNEATVWTRLKHPNVLELLGSSSPSSSSWFFVSPYYENGNLVSFLSRLPQLEAAFILRATHDIAKGMAYLHSMNILHGDLKGANVLVGNEQECLICDFGQSQLKSELYKINGKPLSHGTFRWRAPELMSGQAQLEKPVDVYAFSICCIEVLGKGELPWGSDVNDDDIRESVLDNKLRPNIPQIILEKEQQDGLIRIVEQCWAQDPSLRLSFRAVVKALERLRSSKLPPIVSSESTHNSVHSSAPSPAPIAPPSRMLQAEEIYRKIIRDPLDSSLSLPLWHPTPVSLGAVGYYCVPKGEFVTLFNAFDPRASSNRHAERIPSLNGYGKVSTGGRPRHKRNLVQRLLDDIRTSSSFRFRASAPSETKVARTYVHPQQPGQQAAYLFAESLVHRFMRSADLQVPKLWFAANADAVVELYGAQHEVTRDTLSLVTGTLEARKYAMFASDGFPEEQIRFEVYASTKRSGQWGRFPPPADMPLRDGELERCFQSRVSDRAGGWDALIVARIGYKEGSSEPQEL